MRSGSCPAMPGYAGPCASALIASANALNIAGFVAVCADRVFASALAPAKPLLKCSSYAKCREAAKSAPASRSCALAVASSDSGSHNDSNPYKYHATRPPSPAHHPVVTFSGSWVDRDRARESRFPKRLVPPMTRRHRGENRGNFHRVVATRSGNPIEERLPQLLDRALG